MFKNGSIPLCMKRTVYDAYVLSVMTYDLETVTLPVKSKRKLCEK